MKSKMLPNARVTALRHVDKLRAELKGQQVPDAYLADKAAKYVGATLGQVLAWMRGSP